MKQLLYSLCACALVLGSTQAAVVLNETFSYADGSLVTNSAGIWSTHSGTDGQVDVVSGQVNLTQSETEDVNALLEGGPYSAGNLYASFKVNFSRLPSSGAGTYFAHFKDDSAAGFRARVFATITDAAAGQFRVGVSIVSGTFVAIPTDLSLGQDYVLVLRYDLETRGATLWINPASESSTADRAETTDTSTALPISTFALRQSNATGGMGALTLDDLKVGTAFADVAGGGDPTLNPPTIGGIASQSIAASTTTIDIPFVINDGETPAAELTLSADSDNLALVPVESVTFGGSGSDRNVKVTPAIGAQGAALVTVSVTDSDNNTASRTFRVLVGAPTVSAIENQITPKDVNTQPIPFTVGDVESDELTITAISSNEAVVPSVNVIFEGVGTDRTATIIPSSGVAGLTRIWVLVSDGFNTVSNSFNLTVFQTRGVDLTETFTYEDGSVMTNSGFVWTRHSGATGETQVVDGRLLLTSAQGEDINAFLLTGPYLPTEGWILYSSFTVNFSALPSAGGDYFAHFRNVGNSFGARVFATKAGAGENKLRLGIANNSSSPSVVLPKDLDLGTTYTVVTRLNVGTGQSTLWVNPASESDVGVTATDNAFPFDVWTYAFRQSGGIGSLAVDDLKVGTSFSDVSEARYGLQITATGNTVRVSWPKAAQTAGYRLQGNGGVDAGGWADVLDATTEQGDSLVVTFPGTTGNRFFRLIK